MLALIEEHKAQAAAARRVGLTSRKWMDVMNGPAGRQAYLAPLLEAVRGDPVATENIPLFLLIASESMRRGVSNGGSCMPAAELPGVDVGWSNTTEDALSVRSHVLARSGRRSVARADGLAFGPGSRGSLAQAV